MHIQSECHPNDLNESIMTGKGHFLTLFFINLFLPIFRVCVDSKEDGYLSE